MRVIEGTLHDILEQAPADPARDDYVCARLTDKGALLNAMGQLQQAYPELPAPRVPQARSRRRQAVRASPTLATRSEGEHFAAFFEYVTDDQLSAAEARRLRGCPRAP